MAMTEPAIIQRERTILKQLVELSAARARAEKDMDAVFIARRDEVERELQAVKQRVNNSYSTEKAVIELEFQEVLTRLEKEFSTQYSATEKEYESRCRDLMTQHVAEKEEAEKESQEAAWAVTTVHEATKTDLDQQYKEVHLTAAESGERITAIETEAVQLLEDWNQDTDIPPLRGVPKRERLDDALRKFKQRLADAEDALTRLKQLRVPRLFKGERLLGLFILAWLLIIVFLAAILYALVRMERIPVYASGWPRGWYFWFGGVTALVGVTCVLLRIWLAHLAQTRVAALYHPLWQALADAKNSCKRCVEDVEESTPRLLAESKQKLERKLRRVDEEFCEKTAGIKQAYEKDLRELNEYYPTRLAELMRVREEQEKAAQVKYPRLLAELKHHYETEAQHFMQKHQREAAAMQQRRDQAWQALVGHWQDGTTQVQSTVDEIDEVSQRLFPDWNDWSPPAAVPEGMRFGEIDVGLEQVPDGISATESLHVPALHKFALPALLPFPQGGSLLIKAADVGKIEAVRLLQALMFRFLTALPPGKARFTIIDPVGLGENFASFMQLADFDESLVNSRIWTETHHIEQRLTDLTEHMEKVIQKYLRNQFQTIEEYNLQAGEVAEPYRILVVANFPASFNEASARRLVSVVTSGAGCGVFTLISVDPKLPLPHGFNLKDLEQPGVVLTWKDQRFHWRDADFARFPLRLDAPPDAEASNRILQAVGTKAHEAGRVEVPFEIIAPPPERWWTSDSRAGVAVPLGRAGATKLQHLQLGQGTSQHVLIAGKTGSGKSTLLHALITNLALHYSPEEVELYLIDFKKGVEFKTYAAHELPHARVVAIESEREFGLSVLQRLDAELKVRGERFRALSVQDLNAYRTANGESLPRILLIVDEFQEFFIEDDKIAQDVALLLDRLVRQGRAFGIHVLLGSQTLGGAYSLARSTLGQMAVRIALQCSEADAHLILSEDNTAARLLSRPGEAIYNDANGLVEGNDFFQVVWLGDERKDAYLNRIHELFRERKLPFKPQIVFEGNIPADIAKNHLLHALLVRQAGGASPLSTDPVSNDTTPQEQGADAPRSPIPKALQAWLGEAIAIKDPTAAVFRAQSGSNLIIIGQQDETALAMLSSTLIALAAQGATRLHVLDGTPVDETNAGYLAGITSLIPGAKTDGFRELPGVIAEVAAEVERRQRDNDLEAAPVFLVIHGLQRFRELRRQEDDFSFSTTDKPVSPAQQLMSIIREGPGFGVHALIWCDSLNNVNRAFDRQALREFEMRVLLQMSASDSSILIDSPAASRLGMHRALYYTEERGQPEKFRPYGLPAAEWLQEVKGHFEGGKE